MRPLFFAGLMIALTTGQAIAQVIGVQSGEHDGFTRFVLEKAEGGEWSVNRRNGRVLLKMGGPDAQYDTSGVFARIPRSRVSSVVQSEPGGPLEFELNCACRVETFNHRGRWLVVDILDADPNLSAAMPRTPPYDLPRITNRTPLHFGNTDQYKGAFGLSGISRSSRVSWPAVVDHDRPPRQSDRTFLPRPLPFALPEMPSRRTSKTGETLSLPILNENPIRPNVTPFEATEGLSQTGETNLSRAQAVLNEQLLRATHQGLIAPEIGAQYLTDAQKPRGHGAVPSAANAINDFAGGASNVRVSTAADRDLRELAARARALDGPTNAGVCIPSEALAIHKWGSEEAFDVQIGRLRPILFAEFDEINRTAVLKLARTYLYFGFGAEALQALAIIPENSNEKRMLGAIGAALEFGRLPNPNPFADQETCDTDAALWAVFADPGAMPRANEAAILRALSRLPDFLRQYVGPEIGKQFADAGKRRSAEAALRMVDRIAEQSLPKLSMVEATTADLRGEHESATKHRIEVVQGGSEMSAQALIELILGEVERDGNISEALTGTVASYAVEYRRSEIGPRLQRAHALALALNGRFDEAFQVSDKLATVASADMISDVKIPMYRLLIDRAADVDFLKFGLARLVSGETQLSPGMEDDAARRLLELGFFAPASELLKADGDAPVSDQRRLLRARAALGLNMPRQALADLLGLEGEEVQRIRAAALLKLGEFASAAEPLEDVGDIPGSVRSRWFSGLNESLPEGDGEGYVQLVELTKALAGDDVDDVSTPLAQARALVEGSRAARGDIQTLIDAVSAGSVGQNSQ